MEHLLIPLHYFRRQLNDDGTSSLQSGQVDGVASAVRRGKEVGSFFLRNEKPSLGGRIVTDSDIPYFVQDISHTSFLPPKTVAIVPDEAQDLSHIHIFSAGDESPHEVLLFVNLVSRPAIPNHVSLRWLEHRSTAALFWLTSARKSLNLAV